MAKQLQSGTYLLRWSEHVPVSDVQDPLGLVGRGSTRIARQLLHCITSITPRARYFSFLPWCVYNHSQLEKGRPYAFGLWDGIFTREQAFTLGCVAHHKGEPCKGGGLVGSRAAVKWFAKGAKSANFKKMRKFSKGPAWGAYFNSLFPRNKVRRERLNNSFLSELSNLRRRSPPPQ